MQADILLHWISEANLATATTQELRRSTRVRAQIPVLMTSLDPIVQFSESCETTFVNRHGGGLRSPQPIDSGTPVLLKLDNGQAALGRVIGCMPHESFYKIGIRLDKSGNFWGVQPCPPDWLAGAEVLPVSPAAMPRTMEMKVPPAQAINSSTVKVWPLGAAALQPPASAEPMPVPPPAVDMGIGVEDLRSEAQQILESFGRELRHQVKDNLHSLETQAATIDTKLQALERLRGEVAAWLRILPELVDGQLSHVREQARTETQQDSRLMLSEEWNRLEQQIAKTVEDTVRERVAGVRDEVLAETRLALANAMHAALEPIRRENAETISGLHASLQGQFTRQLEVLLREVQSREAAMMARLAAAQATTGTDASNFSELAGRLEAEMKSRLDQMLHNRLVAAREALDGILEDVRSEQLAQARAEVDRALEPLLRRTDAVSNDMTAFLRSLERETDRVNLQIGALRQEKQELQDWLALQADGFRNMVHQVMIDTAAEVKESVHLARDIVREEMHVAAEDAQRHFQQLAGNHSGHLDLRFRETLDKLDSTVDQMRTALLSRLQAELATHLEAVGAMLRGNPSSH